MIDLDPSEPLVLLPVSVEGPRGTAQMRMALDTGSSFVVIPTQVARQIGYPLEDAEVTVDLHTATSPQRAALVTLRGVQAIGVRVALVEAACRDLPEEGPVQGLLGLSFLRHLDVDLHFQSRVLRARGPGSAPGRPSRPQ